MHKDKLKQFLDGELDFNELQKTRNNSDFVGSYKKLIEQSQTQTPDFNPFEKIDSFKRKRFLIVKRMLPYAAIILFVISFFIILQNNPTKNKFALSDQEIAELQHNTEHALLCFSKELNACMAMFEDAKQLQQPANEIRQLKDLKIDKTIN